MKILHITATHLNNYGGIPLVLKNLVDEQNAINNIESRVFSLVADISDANSDYFFKVDLQNLRVFLKSFSPTIVIIHSFFHIEYARVANILVQEKIPYYIEPHGSFVRAALKKSRVKKTLANATVFRRLIKGAYGFIYLNIGEMNASVYHTKRDIIIPNGISYMEMVPPKNDRINLYYIGRFDIHEKGIDVLIDALSIIEKEEYRLFFDFYGTGESESIQYIQRRIKGYKWVTIRLHKPIYGEEKDQLLAQNSISVLLSRHEGQPMTVLESWNYGNPCIITAETNLADEAEKNHIGWKTELKAEKIANTIKKAVKEYTQDRSGYIDRCRCHVKSCYSWKEIAALSCEALARRITIDK